MIRHGVEIESIAGGGDGVAHVDGVVAFIPRTAPGDRVSVELSPRAGGRFARGRLVTIEQPSGDRVEPECSHYTDDRCGGCQLQHIRYETQCAAKSTIVRDAMTRIAKRQTDPIEVTPSPQRWRYRTKLTLAFRRRGPGWMAGLHRYDAPNEVFQVRDCPITNPRVTQAWRDIVNASQHLPAGELVRGTVQMTDTGLAFSLHGGTKGSWRSANAFRAAVPAITECWWTPEGGQRRQVDGGMTAGVATGASFRQVNADVAALLHGYVVERTMQHRPSMVIDAYAGTGSTAIPLAKRGVHVIAIESDRAAVTALEQQLPAGSRALCGRVEHVLATLDPADVVLVNPPRTGLAVEVTGHLSASGARTVMYVSCDPATLARDLTRMPNFRLASIRSFDMFPQTAHVETVCELVRSDLGMEAHA